MGLRERLIEATAKAIDGGGVTGIMPYPDLVQRSAEIQADRTLVVVAAWLREEADQRRTFAYNNPGNDYLLDQAVTIQSCVDSITGSTDGD